MTDAVKFKTEWLCTACDCEVLASGSPVACPVCGAMLIRYLGNRTKSRGGK